MRALRDRLGTICSNRNKLSTICSNRNNLFLTVSSEKLDWEHLFCNRFGRNMKGNRNCWKRTFCSWKDKRGTSCSFWLKRKGTLCSNLLLTDQIVPKFADLCSYCANKVPLLCVPRLFLKQLKEQKAKTRGTLRFWKRDVSSCRVT